MKWRWSSKLTVPKILSSRQNSLRSFKEYPIWAANTKQAEECRNHCISSAWRFTSSLW